MEVAGEKVKDIGASFTAQQLSGEGLVIKAKNDAGVLCDRTFIEAVISGDGSKIRSSYRDAFKSVAFTIACNKSMETGEVIYF